MYRTRSTPEYSVNCREINDAIGAALTFLARHPSESRTYIYEIPERPAVMVERRIEAGTTLYAVTYPTA